MSTFCVFLALIICSETEQQFFKTKKLFFSSWTENCLFFTIHTEGGKNPWVQNSCIFTFTCTLSFFPPVIIEAMCVLLSEANMPPAPQVLLLRDLDAIKLSLLSCVVSVSISLSLSLNGFKLVIFKHVLTSLILKQQKITTPSHPPTVSETHSPLWLNLSLTPSRTNPLKSCFHLHPVLRSGFSH